MSYYSKDTCYLCQCKMDSLESKKFYCPNKLCYYQINHDVFKFKLKIDERFYFITIDLNKQHCKIQRQTANGMYYELIFEGDKVLELSVDEWKKMIPKVEKLQAFR